MIIRPAELPDDAEIRVMAQAFVDLTPYGQWFPPQAINVEELLRRVRAQGMIYVAVDERGTCVGMIAGGLSEHLLMAGSFLEEAIWWVNPEARPSGCGKQLLVALEQWATTNGAVLCKMAAPSDSPVGMLLERQGYTRLETNYVKVLARPTNPAGITIHGVTDDDLQRAVRRERPERRRRGQADSTRSDG